MVFETGRAHLLAGRYAEACPLLEQAYGMTQGIGVQYNLARCYAATGRLASAYLHFQQVAEVSQRSGQHNRATMASDQAAELEPRLSRLLLSVPNPAPGMTLAVDDELWPASQWQRGTPLDSGVHQIVASAPGYPKWTAATDMAGEGRLVTVTVPSLRPLSADPSAVSPDPAGSPGLAPQEVAAIIIGSVGVVGLGASIILGIAAKTKDDDAAAFCDGDGCSTAGVDLNQDALRMGHIATGTFIGGAVLTTTGLLMWFTSPSDDLDAKEQTVSALPFVGPSAFGITLQGRL